MPFFASDSFRQYAQVARFIISGGMAFLTNITLLFLLTNNIGIWYLTSSVIAFLGAFFVSFSMQKYWTFQSREFGVIVNEVGRTIILTLINLFLNTVFMYLFVEFMHIHYLFAQILSAGIIAIETYFVYKNVIFTTETHTS